MIFNNEKDYDNKIEELNQKINKYTAYVEEHPNRIGVKGNIKTLTYVKNELIKEKEDFIKTNNKSLINNTEKWNLHFSGNTIKNHSIPSIILIPIMQKIIDLNYALIRSLKEGSEATGKFSQNFKEEFCLNIKPFAEGSFSITFEPQIFSDYRTTFKDTWNKKAFDKLFELLNCEDDIDKLSEIHESIGTYSIIKYRELLNLLYSKELDVLFEEKGKQQSKFLLKNNNAKKIYNSLKGFDEDSSEKVIKKGVLVAVDSGKFRFGLELSDSNERIDGKYDESLDDLVSDNFKNLCEIELCKINKINSRSGESKDYWELINIL